MSSSAVSEPSATVPAGWHNRIITMRRALEAPPARVYRAWSDPVELARWFAPRVEGSLAVGARSELIWHDRRVSVEVLEAQPDEHLRFRWFWLPGDGYVTQVLVRIQPRGYGTTLTLTDGPFDLTHPGVLDAYAGALEGWGEALAGLRAYLDFTVDIRPAPASGASSSSR
jgi:uncharacterized protein YndB with AHSA1/START domain